MLDIYSGSGSEIENLDTIFRFASPDVPLIRFPSLITDKLLFTLSLLFAILVPDVLTRREYSSSCVMTLEKVSNLLKATDVFVSFYT